MGHRSLLYGREATGSNGDGGTARTPQRMDHKGHGVATTAVMPVKWTRFAPMPQRLVALDFLAAGGDGLTTSMLKEFTGVCCCIDGLLP